MNSLFEKQIFACKPYYYYFSGIITSGEWNLKIFNPAFSDGHFTHVLMETVKQLQGLMLQVMKLCIIS